MSTERDREAETVDIVVALFNGAAYLDELLASLKGQHHSAWRLWVRDDGSTDATLEIVRRHASSDARMVLLESSGQRLGPTAGFGWLLERVPSASRYVMFADQDDVWLPTKIAQTLTAMHAAEAAGSGPVLVHTDLAVVDARLREIDSSFWRYADVKPGSVSLRRLMVQNVVTGATVMMNRALRELVVPVPSAAVYHDWWCACVAAAFGRIVAVPEATILYRQHGANAVGARRERRPRWFEVPRIAREAMGRTDELRSHLVRTAGQAGAFLERHGSHLSESDRRYLSAYARLPEYGGMRRKVAVARLRLRREHGFWRNLGVLLRA
jgi:glycosyltransferase involved in cell wall biosynthesis